MNMAEALEWAADYAKRNDLFEAPKNNRGYVKDNWHDPSPAEKLAVIKELAETVYVPPTPASQPIAYQAIENLYHEHRAPTVYDGRDLIHPNFIREIKELFDGREG